MKQRVIKHERISLKLSAWLQNVKSRQERVVVVVKKVKILWKKLSFPIQKSKPTVERKIENVLKKTAENQVCKTLPTCLMQLRDKFGDSSKTSTKDTQSLQTSCKN